MRDANGKPVGTTVYNYQRARDCVNALAGMNPEAVQEMFAACKAISEERDRTYGALSTESRYQTEARNKELCRAAFLKAKPAERKVKDE